MSTTDVTVERLRVSNLGEVMPIERASYRTPWSVAMFVLELTRPETIGLGIRLDGRLAGYVICSPQADEWHVMNVTVGPKDRRRGLARQLLLHLHSLLEGATGGLARITLEVRPSNVPALTLYAAEGYLVAGRRRAYYPDDGEDALVMWRTPGTQEGNFRDVPAPDLREAARWNAPLPDPLDETTYVAEGTVAHDEAIRQLAGDDGPTALGSDANGATGTDGAAR